LTQSLPAPLQTHRRLAVLAPASALALLAALAPASAEARIFGSNPIPISVGPNGEPANGPSGGASVSGDNRLGRLAGFHSGASNLVGGDSNGAFDVFVWSRPRGQAGLSLTQPARPSGGLSRVSVSSSGAEANGASLNPSVDGSLRSGPRCVAFQSSASNLAAGDRDATSDVFVRNLASNQTYLVSRGIGAAATNPSIDGSCRSVAFQAGGRIYIAGPRGGRVAAIGGGSNPDYSIDGTAVVWERGGGIAIRRNGRTSSVGGGNDPTVSNRTSGLWGVAYNAGGQAYLKNMGNRGGQGAIRISNGCQDAQGGAGASGGVTAFGPARGIITFTQGGSNLCYFNKNTGNSDDLAHGNGPITEVSTSARANFVAFTSSSSNFPFDGNGGTPDVFFKHLIDGNAL